MSKQELTPEIVEFEEKSRVTVDANFEFLTETIENAASKVIHCFFQRVAMDVLRNINPSDYSSKQFAFRELEERRENLCIRFSCHGITRLHLELEAVAYRYPANEEYFVARHKILEQIKPGNTYPSAIKRDMEKYFTKSTYLMVAERETYGLLHKDWMSDILFETLFLYEDIGSNELLIKSVRSY